MSDRIHDKLYWYMHYIVVIWPEKHSIDGENETEREILWMRLTSSTHKSFCFYCSNMPCYVTWVQCRDNHEIWMEHFWLNVYSKFEFIYYSHTHTRADKKLSARMNDCHKTWQTHNMSIATTTVQQEKSNKTQFHLKLVSYAPKTKLFSTHLFGQWIWK